MRSTTPPRLSRVLPLLLAFGLIAGPGVTWVEREVEQGHAEVGALGLLVACLAFVIRPLADELQKGVFAMDHGPWINGRLARWQRWLLPYSSALPLTQGLTMTFGGGAYLLLASAGLTGVDLLAIGFVAIGGLLIGFAFGRLLAGLLIIRAAGLWGAPKWSLADGSVIVSSFSILAAAHSVLLAASYSPVF
jgi:hypothetical protein